MIIRLLLPLAGFFFLIVIPDQAKGAPDTCTRYSVKSATKAVTLYKKCDVLWSRRCAHTAYAVRYNREVKSYCCNGASKVRDECVPSGYEVVAPCTRYSSGTVRKDRTTYYACGWLWLSRCPRLRYYVGYRRTSYTYCCSGSRTLGILCIRSVPTTRVPTTASTTASTPTLTTFLKLKDTTASTPRTTLTTFLKLKDSTPRTTLTTFLKLKDSTPRTTRTTFLKLKGSAN